MDNLPAQNPAKARYVIKAKTKEYAEAIRKLYGSGVSKAQVHKILEITRGDIAGLRVAKHVGQSKVWFIYRGHRYDLKADGTVAAEVKAGMPHKAPVHFAKKVKCQLCGKDNELTSYEVRARCPNCGFQLVGYTVVRRT